MPDRGAQSIQDPTMAYPPLSESEQKKRKQTLERAKANFLSGQLRLRLQYAKLKVEHGWQRQTLSEVENLYFRHSHMTMGRPYPPVYPRRNGMEPYNSSMVSVTATNTQPTMMTASTSSSRIGTPILDSVNDTQHHASFSSSTLTRSDTLQTIPDTTSASSTQISSQDTLRGSSADVSTVMSQPFTQSQSAQASASRMSPVLANASATMSKGSSAKRATRGMGAGGRPRSSTPSSRASQSQSQSQSQVDPNIDPALLSGSMQPPQPPTTQTPSSTFQPSDMGYGNVTHIQPQSHSGLSRTATFPISSTSSLTTLSSSSLPSISHSSPYSHISSTSNSPSNTPSTHLPVSTQQSNGTRPKTKPTIHSIHSPFASASHFHNRPIQPAPLPPPIPQSNSYGSPLTYDSFWSTHSSSAGMGGYRAVTGMNGMNGLGGVGPTGYGSGGGGGFGHGMNGGFGAPGGYGSANVFPGGMGGYNAPPMSSLSRSSSLTGPMPNSSGSSIGAGVDAAENMSTATGAESNGG